MAATPLQIGRVTLTVHDLDRVAAFYQQVIGLHRLGGDASAVQLGAGGKVLLELRRDTAARRHSPREAGLFQSLESLGFDPKKYPAIADYCVKVYGTNGQLNALGALTKTDIVRIFEGTARQK